MSEPSLHILLVLLIPALLLLLIHQHLYYKRRIKTKLTQISQKLQEISQTGSNEKLMVFTDSPQLMELAAQINHLLNDCQKIKANYRREQTSSRKMLANISHDIKTPLTVILGYLEILRLQNDNEMLRKTEAKARQVMELINQFFTLAKLESGDTALNISPVNISEACREHVLGFYDLLTQNHFQVELSIPEAAVYVQADPAALQRIFNNLISNAIRYGSSGAYLGIVLRQHETSVSVDVIDHGTGIAPEAAGHVFDRLYTMEDSRSREIQGNGLGLTIARHLAEQMGGALTLSSIPNEKTTFTLTLHSYSSAKTPSQAAQPQPSPGARQNERKS